MRKFLLVCAGAIAAGQAPPKQWAGPTNHSAQPAWLVGLKAERTRVLRQINFTGGVFDEIPWTQTSWMQPQMHPYDRFFYDPDLGKYTVTKYLDDLKTRYGGIDSLLLWPTYTNIGIDDRNQFDFFRTMPGGLNAVKKVTAELHAAGVKVLWPYNPWDTGTRREPVDDAATFAELLKQTGGDGFNGDTMNNIPEHFWDAAKAADYPLAFEPEGGGSDASLNWDTLGWGYWKYPKIPAVDRFKFLTRGKFMVNVCNRWAKDKLEDLQAAWFNGAGYETWENVWGTWNGITPRDGEAIRRVASMSRFFGSVAGGALLLSPDWEPHTVETTQENVFASRWPGANGTVLWSLVNRAGANLTGQQLSVSAPHGARFYDCYRGQEISPVGMSANAVSLAFDFPADDYGCVLQTGPSAPDAPLAAFLQEMAAMTKAPLSSLDSTWKVMHQTMSPIPKTAPATSPPPRSVYVPATSNFNFVTRGLELEGDDSHGVDAQFPWEEAPKREHAHTLSISAFYMDKYPVTTTNYSTYLKATGYAPAEATGWLRNWYPGWPAPVPPPPPPPPSEKNYTRYGGDNCYSNHGGSVPQPDTPTPGLTLMQCQAKCDADVKCSCVTVQRLPDSDVQNCYFRYECTPDKFQHGTAYDTYVKNTGAGLGQRSTPPEPPARMADWPVTYVSLKEARAYCTWAGGRLPHAWEWSYAAQGSDGRAYPWGDQACDECWPAFNDGNTFTGPENVTAHAPAGDSSFGVSDMAGNVWQYTDEIIDDHTRSVIVRGGSNYRPKTSHWYFPNRGGSGSGPPCTTHNKYMLFDDMYERAGTIGFRCVKDAS